MRKIGALLGSMRIHQKVVLEFLLFVFLVYAVGIGIGINVQQRTMNAEKKKIESLVQYLTRIIDNDFHNLNNQQKQLVYDYNTQRLANMQSISDMGGVVEMVNRIQGRITVLRNSSIYVDKVSLCLIPLDRSISSEPFYEKISEDDLILLKQYYSRNTAENVMQFPTGLYVVQPITRHNLSFPSEKMRSSSYFRISTTALVQSLQEAITSEGMSLHLLYQGRILLSTGSGQERNEGEKAVLAALASNDKTSTLRQDGEKYLVVRESIPTLNLELAACISDSMLVQESKRYSIWLALLTVVTIISFITFIRFSNRLIERPISRFVKAFQEVEHNNLDIVIRHESHDEFAYLYSGFNTMIQKMKTAIQQAYQEKAAAERAELKQLQSQINPHFLYNSFFHIYRMSNMGDSEGTAKLSHMLGDYYEYITRNGSDIVMLEKEYAHAKIYAEIQGVRFGRRITAEFQPLPENCRNVPIPRLILQPILENAYEHGLKDKESDGRITVQVESLDLFLKITIEDNGNGLSEARFTTLSESLLEPEKSLEATGIINVSKRLKIRQGKSSVSVDTPSSGGLKVIIIISRS